MNNYLINKISITNKILLRNVLNISKLYLMFFSENILDTFLCFKHFISGLVQKPISEKLDPKTLYYIVIDAMIESIYVLI